ncbi:MAG TPA: MMPL family transporter [Pseudogracilibacillus sp.]|nr:MMPL family transporter [Pseudogracilibacillus sp.]
MLKPIRAITKFSSSKGGAKVVLATWLVAVLLLSLFLPSSKDYDSNSGEGSMQENMPSEKAEQLMKEAYPDDEGLPALLVFHEDGQISEQTREKITELSEWLESDDKPDHIVSTLPFHQFPEDVQDQMFSEDMSTLLFNVTLEADLETSEANAIMEDIKEKVASFDMTDVQFEITGPAGIAADTTALFKNADFVLMIATVLLIFVLLIAIYRSPILAITPLIIAGIVYGVVDRLIGVFGKAELFSIDTQAISIMLVLLFAVLTDYSLFIFSRYREQLKKVESKYESMTEAMYHVSEPIFFSGSTIFLAMLTLFVTVFKPYNHFAPVFSVAVVVILIAGLTLIPSVFSLMGRRAFWPFIPKVNEGTKEKRTLWEKISRFVSRRPAVIATSLIIVFLSGAVYFTTVNFSYNLLKSFPEDVSSRVGFELLEDHYPEGQLAPVTVLLENEGPIEWDDATKEELEHVRQQLESEKGVEEVTPQLDTAMDEAPRNFMSDDKAVVKFDLVLENNPYETEAIEELRNLRDKSETIISQTEFDSIHFAGQTAEQVDVQAMNKRDMIVLFSLVTVLMTLVLGMQTRSIILPVLMMGTILLSYAASMGFSWFIFQQFLSLDAISYRLPVYTFVFMVALGIDYNIMLVSRIREEAKSYPFAKAVERGVALTGGVISSAGMILAATFAVLITQPLQELYLFGFVMAFGILLDTFIVRGMLMPSILLLINRKK